MQHSADPSDDNRYEAMGFVKAATFGDRSAIRSRRARPIPDNLLGNR